MPAVPSAKEQFLLSYEREHETTMRVLRAFPKDKAELRPHAKCKSARELAWVFVLERKLGEMVVLNDVFAKGPPSGNTPPAPESWDAILKALEDAHVSFGEHVRNLPADMLNEPVTFFTGPGTTGPWPRMQFLWFLLSDQIHHRGQMSIYLRMADGKVPSIYGPSGDEPWM